MDSVIQFRVNGRPVSAGADRERLLLWYLRGELGLTGTKYGCGAGSCGACTVLLDGRAARACATTLGDVHGREVVTIEGLAQAGRLHPLQEAFVAHGALQCGFCTSGMILSAQALLSENSHPSRQQVVTALDDNLCRCGAHQRILDAIESVCRPKVPSA